MKLNDYLFILLGIGIGFLFQKHETPAVTVEVQPQTEAPDTLTDWQKLQMAIIFTESKGNPEARGHSNDIGLYQITPIYVREANRVAGTNYAHSDAFDPLKSVYMFQSVQDYHNPEHDQNKAIKLHNPGGDAIGYSAKVKQNLEYVNRMEAVRHTLIEYEYRKRNESTARGEGNL